MSVLKRLRSAYDEEPVLYCKHCLSLRIMDAGLQDLLYCDMCGSSEVESTDIEDWEKMYEGRYGFNYLEK